MAKAKGKKGTVGRRRVTLFLEAPEAREVFVTGDFNGWDHQSHPMKPDKEGVWSRTFMLDPGTYEYKFIVDGGWRNDPANLENCENCYGTLNSILTVAKK